MSVLKFKVSGQSLTSLGSSSENIAGTKGYLTCNFDTNDSAWIGCQIIAEFNEKEAVLVRNKNCKVPDEYANRPIFSIRLHGIRGRNYHILTDKAYVELKG